MTSAHRLLSPILIAAGVALAAPAGAYAQQAQGSDMMSSMHSGHDMMDGDNGSAMEPAGSTSGAMPTMPGQEAFGTIQEIVQLLDVNPTTDWSKVNITALREHLVDMNSLTMNADVTEEPIAGGLRMTVTGTGLTLRAIHAMIPAHVPMIDGMNGWAVRAETTPDGAILTATAAGAKEALHIQGLGFFGLMATGAHHQVHHMNIARGEPMQVMH